MKIKVKFKAERNATPRAIVEKHNRRRKYKNSLFREAVIQFRGKQRGRTYLIGRNTTTTTSEKIISPTAGKKAASRNSYFLIFPRKAKVNLLFISPPNMEYKMSSAVKWINLAMVLIIICCRLQSGKDFFS